MVVFCLEILDLDVNRPSTTQVSPSMIAIVATEQAVLLASANTWRCTALICFNPFRILLGTRTVLSCLFHVNHTFVNFLGNSVFHSLVDWHVSLYSFFHSTTVGDISPRGSYIRGRRRSES